MSNNTDINTPAFQSWLVSCQSMIDADMKANFPSLPRNILVYEQGSKFIRVWSVGADNQGGNRSCYAFIARSYNKTKALGTVLAGDVLKPATWKQPAKHARGNIYDASNGTAKMGVYGPAYLNQ